MSWLTTLLISLLNLGAGVMIGYGALYLRYSSECHMLLETTKAKALDVSKQLEVKYTQLQASHNNCIQGESEWQKKCHDQQSQTLGAHSSLTMKHQSLLEEHADALEKLTMLHKETDSQQQIIQSLRDQVKQLQRGEQQRSDSSHLREQLSLMESLLQDKMQEVQTLEAQLSHSGTTFASSQLLSTLKSAIQRQQWAQTLLQYHTAGPFRVEFTLDVSKATGGDPGSSSSGGSGSSSGGSSSSVGVAGKSLQTFVVELVSAESYSMTVGTFLKLAEAGLYVGTTLRYMDRSGGLVGGNPQQAASKRAQSNLARRLAEHGYGTAPFLWMEQASSSDQPKDASSSSSMDQACGSQPGAFWFPSQGQHFHITLPGNAKLADQMEEATSLASPATPVVAVGPDDDEHGSRRRATGTTACHGRIVQGLAGLYKVFAPTILEDEDNRPRITIANTRVLLPPEGATTTAASSQQQSPQQRHYPRDEF